MIPVPIAIRLHRYQRLHGMIKVQNPCRLSRAARVKQAPEPVATIPLPDHVWSVLVALAQRCEPQLRREGIAGPQDSHSPTLRQPRDALPWPHAMLAQAGQYTPFRPAPAGLACWHTSLGPQRPRHTIDP